MEGEVSVSTGAGSYRVVVGTHLNYGRLMAEVIKPCRAVLVSDDNVFPRYGDAAKESLCDAGFDTAVYVIPHGEVSKSLATVGSLLDFLAKNNLTRGDILVALGGGVVGDITGFAAAIYLRGVAYFQLPTTLLSAVDSSVGGKTGVDLAVGKNLAGAFHQPLAVFCDTSVFSTLPKNVYADGMAEVIKHGMIADGEMLASLGDLTDTQLCLRNVKIKAEVVSSDEFDTGRRRLLNFGHSVGHAVESLSAYQVSHGSAVAIGMTVVTRAAVKAGLAEPCCLDVLTKALERYALRSRCSYSARTLASAALCDKKRLGEVITLVIPKKPGKAELYELPVAELESFIAKGLDG